MRAATIFYINAAGGLSQMKNATPATEDRIQELVAQHSELLCSESESLLLIKREQSVPDSAGTFGRWSLDHLFVSPDGIPVLVELKRATDTRLRREVVGQILDYAANATAYWGRDELERSFRATHGDESDTHLTDFIGGGSAPEFWQRVETNLRQGNIRLVIAADVIPGELERIIEFLNEQMKADVRGVELRWFEGPDGTLTLVPRHIGGGALIDARKRSNQGVVQLSTQEWIMRFGDTKGDMHAEAAVEYVQLIGRLGGSVVPGSSNGSLVAVVQCDDGREAYPFHLWAHSGFISLSFKWLKNRPGLQDPNIRKHHIDELKRLGIPLSTNNPDGFPSFLSTLLLQKDQLNQVERCMAKVVEDCRKPGLFEG